MPARISVNGQIVPPQKAVVSVYDHGLLYGDGVFEGIRVYGGKAFLLREHIERLYESARAIRLEIPIDPPQMTQRVDEAVAAAIEASVNDEDFDVNYVRLVVTRGAGDLGLDVRKASHPQVIIIADSITMYAPQVYEQGMRLITASTTRNIPSALNPRIKSLNYLNNILAKIEGTDAGAVEALMLNHKGEVAECTGDNIFIVKHRVIKTPPPEAGILEGITRNAVIGLAREANLPVVEVLLTRHDVYTADECFLTGTAAEVIAVVALDGRAIGNGEPGPITRDMLQRFQKLTQSSE